MNSLHIALITNPDATTTVAWSVDDAKGLEIACGTHTIRDYGNLETRDKRGQMLIERLESTYNATLRTPNRELVK